MKIYLLLFLAAFSILRLPYPSLAAREYPCHSLSTEPVVDGRDDDAAWKSTPECFGFRVLGTDRFAVEKQTSFKAGHTADSLFMFVRCEEPATHALQGEKKDGRSMWNDDSLELFFIPSGTTDLYNLVANWTGARWNGMGHGDARPLWNWTAKTQVGKTEWTLEAKVPFSVFSRTPADGERWQTNIARNILTSGDRYTCWPSLREEQGFRDLENYGVFIFKNGQLPAAECARMENESASRLFASLKEHRQRKLSDDVLAPLQQLAAEAKDMLATDRHPEFPRLRQRLADLQAEALATSQKLEQAKDLSWEQWRALFNEVSSLQAEVPRLKSDLALVSLYPTNPGKSAARFVLGTAGQKPWMDESALAQCDTTGPIRVSLVAGESTSFRMWVIPFWSELKDVKVVVTPFRSGAKFLPEGCVVPHLGGTGQTGTPASSRRMVVQVSVQENAAVGTYKGKVTVTADGNSVSRNVEIEVKSGKLLNNFVTELVEVTRFSKKAKQRFTFDNPRAGWVYLRVEAKTTANDKLWIALDSEEESQAVIAMKSGETVGETMRRIPTGKHTVCLGFQGKTAVKRLAVRAVPEIIYASYRYDPRIGKEFGVFDWEFLNRYVLPNINTINGPGGLPEELAAKHAAEWHARGGRCVKDTGLPKLDTSGPLPTVEETCKELGDVLSQPNYDAILADECILSPAFHSRNLIYAEAFKRLAADLRFKGKDLYPYIAGQSPGSQGFLHSIAELPTPMMVEYYCIERKTEEEAKKHISEHADSYMKMLREVMDEPHRRSIFALFYETLSPCSANIHPQTDFKVFLDMQFHHLANAPGMCGIFGVEGYTSGYTDEETLRWTSRLFRHYCIEGHRDRLTTDPVILPHLTNPDFANGLQGWEITSADKDSVKAFRLDRLGKLMGFWPGTPQGGDDCLWMKRSAKAPNSFSQDIRDLKPGRLYSLKLFTHDVSNPNVKEKHAVSIRLDNVDLVEEKSFQAVFPGELSWSAKSDYKWLNCHYRIFRAKSETAHLTVSDWQTDTQPGGPVGQELVYDFVEMQPYFAAGQTGTSL